RARALVDRLSRADYEGASAGFDTIMRGSLPPPRLRALWQQVTRKTGPFAEVSRANVAPVGAGFGLLLTCRFCSASRVVQGVFDVGDQIAGLAFLPADALTPWSAPTYAQRERFTERDVSLGAPTPLPGTLSLPKGQGPFPLVVLVHGSGPSDADASMGPNKM